MTESQEEMIYKEGYRRGYADAEPKWIPCSERLPSEPFPCLVTVMDYQPMTLKEFEEILPYFVGFDGERWNDYDGDECPFEILAWMPLPSPWKGADDEVD